MITKPTLLLDELKCKANIKMMAEKARSNNCIFRPHFKTHQSLAIGAWFKEVGVEKITVSSLSMAKYFSQKWKDITVAFPVNILEIDTINELANKVILNLLVESPEIIDLLQDQLTGSINVLIKIDTGYNRTGVAFDNLDLIDEIIDKIEASSKINFVGFLSHAGYSYQARGEKEIAAYHLESLSRMDALCQVYRGRYPDLICSVGDTPTCSVMEDFQAADELRPGNFIFYDLTQELIGSCNQEQIAVAMACPVVAIHADRNEMMIYGGGVHFSKDYLETEKHGKHFGHVVENNGHGWGQKIDNAILRKISQEHGTVQAPPSLINQYKIGDIIKILPVHSCMTANLLKSYQTTDGRIINFS